VTVATEPGSVDRAVLARVALGGSSARATLTVNAPRLQKLTVTPSTVKGGATTFGTVTLTGPAPAGGVVVKLATNAVDIVTISPTVTVPAGASTATFAITTRPVAISRSVAITALQNLETVTCPMNVSP
ncbi:MAG: hypothetical protein ACOVT5_06310, partial [Armatimonadaceae bacterium]